MIDVAKVNRGFRSHYYTNGKICEWANPREFLLSGGTYSTKIRPEALPPWYISITWWNTRWVDTSRVTDIDYRPCRIPHYNHLFKDDYLYLAYDGDRLEFNELELPSSCGYETLWGYELVEALVAVREYSGLDITPQLDQLKKRILRYNEEYDEPWPEPGLPYDPDEIIAEAEQRIKERREAYELLYQGTHRP